MLQTDHSESRDFVSERVGAARPSIDLQDEWFVQWGQEYGDKINDMIDAARPRPSARLRPSVAG